MARKMNKAAAPKVRKARKAKIKIKTGKYAARGTRASAIRVGSGKRKIARGASKRSFPTARKEGGSYLVPQHAIVSVFDAGGRELESIPLNSTRAAFAEARQLADIFSRASGARIHREDGPGGTRFVVGDRTVGVVKVPAGTTRRLNPARRPASPKVRPNPMRATAPRRNPAKKNHHLKPGQRVSLGGLGGRVAKSLPGDKYIVQFDDGGREVVAGFKLSVR